MAGTMAGGIAIIGNGMFIDRAGGALMLDCAGRTCRFGNTDINGEFCSVRTPAESAQGYGQDDHYHQ